MEDVTQLFTSCSELRTVSATSFDNSKIKKYASVLYGCSKLVGGTDGFVPSPSSGASVLKLGTGGVLTDPESDIRTWLDATLFADGELKIGFAKADAAGREVLAAGKLCANAKYNASQATHYSKKQLVRRLEQSIAKRTTIDASPEGLPIGRPRTAFRPCPKRARGGVADAGAAVSDD